MFKTSTQKSEIFESESQPPPKRGNSSAIDTRPGGTYHVDSFGSCGFMWIIDHNIFAFKHVKKISYN